MALIYDVEVRYRMTGGALGGLSRLTAGARGATSAFRGLGTAMALVSGAAVIGKAKKAFYDFNSEVATLKVGLATAFSANLKMPFQQASAEADKLFGKFQAFAKDAPGTSKDYLEVASWIGRSMAVAGGSMKQLEMITEATTLASQIYPSLRGAGGMQIAARDIDQFLRGMITVRDPLANQILTEQGKTRGEANKATMSQRMDMLMKWAETAQKPGGALFEGKTALRRTPQGAWSAIEEQFQILMGRAGEALTKQIVSSMVAVTDWINKNQNQIDAWVKSLSNTLVAGWNVAKDVANFAGQIVGFISENKELLMTLAKMYLVIGGAKMIGGAGGIIQGLTSMAGAINPVILGLGAFAVGLSVAAGWIGDEIDKRNRHDTLINGAYNPSMNRFNSSANRLNQPFAGKTLQEIEDQRTAAWVTHVGDAMDVLMLAKDAGALTPVQGAKGIIGVNLDQAKLLQYLAKNNVTGDDAQMITKGVGVAFDTALQEHGRLLQRLFGVSPGGAFDAFGFQRGALSEGVSAAGGAFSPVKNNINVSINKIEVASDDPDRFVMGMVRSFEEVIRNPTQAEAAIRGGIG